MTIKYITNNNITFFTVNINIYNNTEKSHDNVSISNKESIRLLKNIPSSVTSDDITPVKELNDNNEIDSLCSLISVKNKNKMYE